MCPKLGKYCAITAKNKTHNPRTEISKYRAKLEQIQYDEKNLNKGKKIINC